MSMLEDLKNFALRGNVVDLAVGFTVGAAFTSIARSAVDDIIMPPVGLLMGRVNFADLYVVLRQGQEELPANATLAQAQAAGAVTLNYGQFINAVIAFLLITLVMFFLIRLIMKLERELDERTAKGEAPPEATTKKCPYCFQVIPAEATRCGFCTSQLEGAPQAEA